MEYISVAIDGPSGAGKSTVARAVAARMGYVYVDTGAMYRAIGLAVYRRGIAGEDTAGIIASLPTVDISLAYQERTYPKRSARRKSRNMRQRFRPCRRCGVFCWMYSGTWQKTAIS